MTSYDFGNSQPIAGHVVTPIVRLPFTTSLDPNDGSCGDFSSIPLFCPVPETLAGKAVSIRGDHHPREIPEKLPRGLLTVISSYVYFRFLSSEYGFLLFDNLIPRRRARRAAPPGEAR